MPTDYHDKIRPDPPPLIGFGPQHPQSPPNPTAQHTRRSGGRNSIGFVDSMWLTASCSALFSPSEYVEMMTAGMMRIFPWMRRRNTIRRRLSCISAAESWSRG
jgi:hypothetical protein